MKVHGTQNGWCHACGGVGDPDVAEHVAMMSPTAQRLVGPGVVGSTEWRAEHLAKGDLALNLAYANLGQIPGSQPVDKTMAVSQLVGAYAAIAQAHYAAANVRYRP